MQKLHPLAVLLLVATVCVAAYAFWPREDVAPSTGPERATAATPEQGPGDAAKGAAGGGASDVATPEREASGDAVTTGASVVPPAGAVVFSGRVVDERGSAVAGAEVRLRTTGAPTARENAPRRAPPFAPPLTDSAAPRLSVVTDAQGVFRVRADAVAGTSLVRVLARGFRVLDKSVVRPSGEEVDLGALTLQRGAIVGGRVVDAAGKGVAGARVQREGRRTMPNLGDESFQMPDVGDFDVPDIDSEDAAFGAAQFGDAADAPGGDFLRDVFAPRVVTDADGRFELAHCDPGEFSLRARHADYPSARRDGLNLAAGATMSDVEIAFPAAAVIRGRVTGVPEGMKVRVLASAVRNDAPPVDGPGAAFGAGMAETFVDFGGFGERSSDVAADGAFALRGLNHGRSYRIWATQSGQGFVGGAVCTQRIEAAAPSDGVELRYDPGVIVTFRVVDPAGQPVERLWVRDQLRGGGGGGGMSDFMAMAPRSRAAKDCPDGRVTLTNLRPKKKQTLALTIDAIAFRTFEWKDIALPATGTVDLGAIRLEASPVVEIVVTSGDGGQPVAGATARVTAAKPAEGGNPFERMMGRALGEVGPRSGRTDAAGRCVVNAPIEPSIVVVVTSPEYAPYRSDPFAPPAAGRIAHAVVLQRGGSVEVAVADTGGAPLGNVRVLHAPPAGGRDDKSTDPNGVVTFDHLAPGEHRFKLAERGAGPDFAAMAAEFGGAPSPGNEPGWQAVSVTEGGRTPLRLTRDPAATLRGVVRENGSPLAGARVVFVAGAASDAAAAPADGLANMMAEFGGGDGGRSAKTAVDGSYALKNLRAGVHRLRITNRERAMPAVMEVVLQPGDNVFDVALDVAVVRGTVRDPEGKPMAGASVTVVRVAQGAGANDPMAQAFEQIVPGMDPAALGAGLRSVKSAADGTYELRGLEVGATVQVRATAKPFAPAQSATLRVSGNDSVDLRLLAAGKLRVTLAEAAPFTSAQARLLGADGAPVPGIAPVVQLLANGAATLGGLCEGRWKIDILRPGGTPPPAQVVDIKAGETATVSF